MTSEGGSEGMTERRLRVLILEDNESDAALTARALQKSGREVEWMRLESGAELRRALQEGPWDLVLSDYVMPQFTALDALDILREVDSDAPFLIISGTIGEETAVAAMRAGAWDYFMKDKLARLPPAIDRALAEAEQLRTRHRLERQRALMLEVLQTLNQPEEDPELAQTLADGIRRVSGLEAVAIRLPEGPDFPYAAMSGFSPEVVAAGCSLLARGPRGEILTDEAGEPILECLCGAVLCGGDEAGALSTTARGSFWTESFRGLVAAPVGGQPRLRVRPRCAGQDWESVALVPLRGVDKLVGMLQLNDRRRGAFSEGDIESFEATAQAIATALDRRASREAERRGREVAAAVASATLGFLADGDVRRTIGQIVESAATLTGARLGALLELDRKGATCLRAMWGVDLSEFHAMRGFAEAARAIERSGTVPLDMGDNLLTAVIRGAAVVRSNEPRHDPRATHGLPSGHPPIDNLLASPMASDDRVLGALVVANRPGGFGAGEEATLSALSNVAALCLRVARETEDKDQAQDQLMAAQRLDTVGRLAGGVAHDFNNSLTVISSYADLAIEALREGDPLREDIEEIRKAGRRATALTRQLLAFSRKQTLRPVAVDLNGVIEDLDRMVRRLIGEDIEVHLVLAPDLESCLADPGQVEQVIMNLVVNARDAMPDGGRLTLETANAELDASYESHHLGAAPGRYVMVAVTDTGAGMDKATRERVFEPFFTTKPADQGTGLGLSTVYGIVKQSRGSIWAYSEVGQGTVFKVYLPATEIGSSAHPRPAARAVRYEGSETILLVEDDEAVRRMAQRILSAAGYKVLVAANGGEALLSCEQLGDEIRLVVTDVIMPGLSGRQLADRLAVVSPAMKVVYMSGYTDDAITHHGVLDPGVRFVAKPFTARELTRAVREALDDGGGNVTL